MRILKLNLVSLLVIINICTIKSNIHSQTISFGSEFGGVVQYTSLDSTSEINLGFNAGLYFNISVINKVGFDAKIMYERFNKEKAFLNFYPFFQYYGNDYTQFGMAPLLYIEKSDSEFDLSNTGFGVAFSFGNKYMGITLSTIEFKQLKYNNMPTIKLSAHMRLGFLDKFINI